jgi:hypothetical protein
MAVPVGGDRGGCSRLRVLVEARGPLLCHAVDFKATMEGNTEMTWSSRRSPGGEVGRPGRRPPRKPPVAWRHGDIPAGPPTPIGTREKNKMFRVEKENVSA